MSDTQDGAVLSEAETVTVNTEAQAESVDPNSTDSTESATENITEVEAEAETKVAPELTDEQKAAAQAEAEAKAKVEAERLDKLATDFIDNIGMRNDEGVWVSGLIVGDQRDASTGFFPDGVINDLRAKFNELPAGAPRTKVKNWVDAEVGKAMEDPSQSPYARSFFMIKKHALVSTGASKAAAPRVSVDPTEAFVAQVVSLYIAPYMVQVPENVDANWPDLVNAESERLVDIARAYAEHQNRVAALPEDATEEQRAELEKSAPEAPEVVKVGFRLARGRAASTTRPKKSTGGSTTGSATRPPRGDGTRKNIANHILNAFAGKPINTVLSINEVVRTASDEYGSESPSPGAVSARLFPDKTDPTNGDKCTVPGVVGVINADGRKAAKLVG